MLYIYMESIPIEFGTRKLQKSTGGHTIAIPHVIIESYGMKAHDKIAVSVIDGDIILKRVDR